MYGPLARAGKCKRYTPRVSAQTDRKKPKTGYDELIAIPIDLDERKSEGNIICHELEITK